MTDTANSLPKPTISTYSGWLAPDGLLYPCDTDKHPYGPDAHTNLAAGLLTEYHLRTPVLYIMEIWGFVRLSRREFHILSPTITAAQEKTIVEYQKLHDISPDNILSNISLHHKLEYYAIEEAKAPLGNILSIMHPLWDRPS